MFYNMLESTRHVMSIPTDPEELATMLDSYALDWAVVLHFLDSVSSANGITIDTVAVRKIMLQKFEE